MYDRTGLSTKCTFIKTDLFRPFPTFRPKFRPFVDALLIGHSRKNHTNMKTLRESMKIMSVNQISCYHVGIEMFNIINHASSKSIQENLKIEERGYSLRRMKDGQVKVPEKGKKSCIGFSYTGPKLWNYLPSDIRTTKKRKHFKKKLKNWIWTNIPAI